MAKRKKQIVDDEAELTTEDRAKLLLIDRQRSYQLAFFAETSAMLLEDIKRFCRAESTTFHEDPRIHAALEGRREVWLRIQDHLNLDPDHLWEKYR